MKPILKNISMVVLLLVNSLQADNKPENGPAAEELEQVQQLIKAKKIQEAVELLQTRIQLHPESAEAHTQLGAIYTMILKQPAKGEPFLEAGWELGDKNALGALALSYLLTSNRKGILNYQDAFIDHFDQLQGSRFVGFYIAAENEDKQLFLDLLKRVTIKDIQKDELMAKTIARAAKTVLE